MVSLHAAGTVDSSPDAVFLIGHNSDSMSVDILTSQIFGENPSLRATAVGAWCYQSGCQHSLMGTLQITKAPRTLGGLCPRRLDLFSVER